MIQSKDGNKIKLVIKKLWKDIGIGQKFNGTIFSRKVKSLLNKHKIGDDTVLRCLRDLRQKNEINYDIVNRFKSEYMKCEVETSIDLQPKPVKRKSNKLF